MELTLTPAQESQLDRLGLEFLAEFLETALQGRPEDPEVLGELGHVYTRLGRLEEGLDADRRLVRVAPDNATAHYNLACSLALLGRDDEALDELEQAIDHGYQDAAFLARDDDLESLRGTRRFEELLERLRQLH